MKNKIVLLAVCLLALGAPSFTQTKRTAEIAPAQIVKNLYAAHKSPATDPFLQKKSRVLLDKFFTRQLADLLWRDATSKKDGEFGNLDFDPLFGGTELKITNLVIGKADEQSGIVTVTFKNHTADEKVRFSLTKENTASKVWKIDSIMYRDAEDLGSILEDAVLTDAEHAAAGSRNKMDGDYLVGGVKCNITTNKRGYWARVKCDDQENFQVIDTETLTFGTFDPQEKGRRGKFVRADDQPIVKFIDASGKEFKVSRIN